MSSLRPAVETWVDPRGDRCATTTARALPTDCPSRCKCPGCVCATSPRRGEHVPRGDSWRQRLGRYDMSTVEFIPIKPLTTMDSAAPGSYVGHSTVLSPDRGCPPSIDGCGPSRCDSA